MLGRGRNARALGDYKAAVVELRRYHTLSSARRLTELTCWISVQSKAGEVVPDRLGQHDEQDPRGGPTVELWYAPWA